MSNKNLLNESQVRQFMKLANLQPLSPGFVHGLTERSAAEVDESNGRGKKEAAGGYNSKNGAQNARNEGFGDEMGAPEDELDAEDELAGEEGEEIDDLEGELDMADDEMGDEEGGRMVSVDDFLAALESALETAMGDEVEVDASEMSDEIEDDEDLEAADEFAPEGEDVVADDELEDELMDEGFVGKDYEKMAKGKKGSYAPDPEAGEKDYTPTPEEAAKARAHAAANPTSSRDKFPRRRSGGGGGMKIGGITAEGQDALVEQITKRVAARIIKSALAKK